MNKLEIKTLNHCAYSLNYHLVMVTKYRKRCLTQPMLDEFSQQARERCLAWGGEVKEVNGEADHVHLLIELPPSVAIADFVNALKTGTSRRLRNLFADHLEEFYQKPTLWSRSYFIASCGGAPPEVIKQYVQQQERPGR